MKKILSLTMVLLMLLSACSVFAFSASAEYPLAADVFDGYENLCLTYTYNPNASNYGRHLPEDLKPYVGYYGTDGKLQDFFFDSYLFLPCVTNGVSGARLHYDQNNPTKAIDWEAYVDDTFYNGTNVDALEVAFGEAKNALGDNDRKAGVVLTILYPAYGQTDFGTLGGKTLNFNNFEDRKYAIKWMIDEQLSRFDAADYQNLDLIGFYWLEEYLITAGNKEENVKLYQYTAEYLHSLGLKFVWIPWYRANGYNQWKTLGFDAVCMQPNMYWEKIPTDNRVTDCASDCKLYGMGMEIEIDGRALTSAEYYNRYIEYLEGGVKSGAMNTVKMYYQDAKSGIYYRAWKSTDERTRSIYDLTYKYAKGTLTLDDLEKYKAETFAIPEDVNWRSIGKKYVATEAYYDGNGADYQDIDGKELTDGVIGASELGTEWHGFHKSILDPDGRMSVTVNLGAIYKDLTHFMAHFSHVENYGIDDPDDVRIEISTDGENFTLIASPELQMRDISAYVSYNCAPVTAQYVKFSFINSEANFVFCSEVLVGAGEAPKDNESSASASDTESGNTEQSLAVSESETSEQPDDDNNTAVWIGVGIVAIAAVISILAAVTVAKRKKKN